MSAIKPWTPLHLELMLHYYCSLAPFGRDDAPAVVDYTDDLVHHGLLFYTESRDTRPITCAATDKGKVFVEMLCSTPQPEQTWVDPRTREEVRA